MAVVNVQSNGVAPSGLSAGDVVKTGGGNFQIVNPGTPGASYSRKSGYWSVPVSNIVNNALSGNVPGLVSSAQAVAKQNNSASQSSADKQMQFQTDANAKAMKFSASEAEKNRKWQEQMSNTAHQREVEDLMAAGLNPILSAMGGSGATTPSGASASGVSSSGAMSQIDTSVLGMLGNVLGSIINGNYSKAIAEINRDSQITTAQINARSASNVANINSETQKYIEKEYPDNVYSASKYVGTKLGEIIRNLSGGSSARDASDRR